jgi:hypothetical protein
LLAVAPRGFERFGMTGHGKPLSRWGDSGGRQQVCCNRAYKGKGDKKGIDTPGGARDAAGEGPVKQGGWRRIRVGRAG